MKLIPLSKNRYQTMVDDDDFEKYGNLKWNTVSCKKRYVIHSISKHKICYLHRLIMNCPEGMEVDHKNGDALDNRKCNLRICTRIENARNRIVDINTITGFKGVSLKKDKNRKLRYIARVCINRKPIWSKHFETAIEAAIAYNEKAQEIFGEFACLNKIK